MHINTKLSAARKLVPATALLAGLTLVAACGSSSSGAKAGAGGSTPAAAADAASAHDAADVTFASDMIPHHSQAVEMADMALKTAVDPEIKKLATAIKGAQDPEIVKMTDWLKSWNAPVPQTGPGHMTGMAMNGMMSDAEMADLGKTTGKAFDTMWVSMMTRHHQGAIAMANIELSSGQSSDAKALAQQIITGQTAEVAQMKAIARRLA
jgi:uncharacterized protein (DUF305 family)